MTDRPTPETKEAWDAVSRLPSGMHDSRVSIWAYVTAMSDHSRKMERQRDELLEAIQRLAADFECEGDNFRAESWRNLIAAVKGVNG